MVIPVGDLSPRRTGMGKKCSRERSCGSPWEKKIVAGTKMWSYLPARNSPLPSLIITVYGAVCFRFLLNMVFAAAGSIL
jgi:hypothetical protein